jgi:hypothetical protein
MEPPLYRSCFDTTGLLESVCETFTNLNDPARGEPVHRIFMANFPNHTNQGAPSQGDSCAFSFFKNVGVPLMATLYIPGLNVELLVWLGTIPNVSNALDASQLRTLIHGHPIDVSSSAKSSPPPSTTSGESTVTSNQKPKLNRKRKNRKKKSPTSASHVGNRSKTSAIHVEDQHPASTSYVGGTHLASASYARGKHPPSASHDGGKSPVPASHTGNRSVASTSHVIDPSPTSASHVGDVKPITASHVGGINSIEKPRWIRHKPKFPCKLYKGDHLTHLCPGIPEVQRLWSLSASSSDSESFEVSSQSIQPLVEKVVMSMQSSVDPTPLLGGKVPLDHVVLQPIQPLVVKVVMSMQSLDDPTLLLGSDVSTDYVFSISGSVLSEQGGIPLIPSTPPPSPRMVSFDWNDLVEPHLPSTAPFQIRVEVNSTNIYRCIVDEGAYASILSSSVWKVLGSLELVSSSHELLAFDRRPSEYLGVLPQLPISLGGKIVHVDVIVGQGPLDFNMLLGRDYVYAMNDVVSMLFRMMHFPHNGSIVTINQLASNNHHPNSALFHTTPLYVLSVHVDSTPPRVNYVASYPRCSIASEQEPVQSCLPSRDLVSTIDSLVYPMGA